MQTAIIKNQVSLDREVLNALDFLMVAGECCGVVSVEDMTHLDVAKIRQLHEGFALPDPVKETLPSVDPYEERKFDINNVVNYTEIMSQDFGHIRVHPFYFRDFSGMNGGVGGTVACESALRSARTLLSRVRASPSAARPDGGP
ncbi:hypothetical protein PoB_006013000 [Plakobranchus ocellatus]|uniref:Uncharacterized protein n=1 Tax=Plakobranchus ocellatus TaxID=259542 RepID=A0AAV4CP38_9GAST|nr:hypothetical protein PoB_006013000 [Plakobranchus ocellatus]